MHGTGVFEQMLHAKSPRGGHDAIRGEKRARKEEGKDGASLCSLNARCQGGNLFAL